MDAGEIYVLIAGTAYMLRGMTLDPAIPEHAKETMRFKITKLEAALDEIEL